MKMYFSEDGFTIFGEHYKHLATHEVEMPEEPEKKKGFAIIPRMNPDTKEGYWEEREIPKTEEERIDELEKENLDLWDLVLFGGDE